MDVLEKNQLAITWRNASRYQAISVLVGFLFMLYYANNVCEYVARLTFLGAALMIGIPLCGIVLIRIGLIKRLFETSFYPTRTQNIKTHMWLELALWMGVSLLLMLHNTIVFGFPLASGLKLAMGFLCLGAFTAMTLFQDIVYNRLHSEGKTKSPEDYYRKRYFSISKRLQVLVVLTGFFIMLVLSLLLRASLLTSEIENAEAALMFLYQHIFFVFTSYILCVFMVALKYGRNLHYLLENQIQAFASLLEGDYEITVPAISNDEIGRIATATNELALKLETQRSQTDSLQKLAMIDPLTQAYNRRYLEEQIVKDFQTTWFGRYVSFIIIDADHFKQINDQYGHEGGDLVLVRLVALIKSNIRASDLVVRLGGEEFLVVLPECPAVVGLSLAKLIRKSIEHAAIEYGEAVIAYTASLGVSTGRSGDIPFNDLLRQADKAVYQAKDEGRNRVVVA